MTDPGAFSFSGYKMSDRFNAKYQVPTNTFKPSLLTQIDFSKTFDHRDHSKIRMEQSKSFKIKFTKFGTNLGPVRAVIP